PKNFSYNSSQGWCPKCRGFGELFYLPDVDRGARADAIEESWFDWQEGNREICPECNGARLNPVARSVRLTLGNCSSRAPQTPSARAGKKILNAKFSSSSSSSSSFSVIVPRKADSGSSSSIGIG